jgi:cyclase
MLKKRIIAALDIANGRVVKGVHFIGQYDMGDPAVVAKAYAAQGVDELCLLDIMATVENRETTYDLKKEITALVDVPVTLSGGIRCMDDFRKAFDCGVSKVAVTSAFVTAPELVQEASAAFGKEKIVVSFDAKKVGERYHLFIKGGREDTGLDLLEWAPKAEALGAGEILLNSMDGDGTLNGYDIAMTRAVVQRVSIPVIASGGCGQVSHIIDVFKETGCDAALVASLLHYKKATVEEIKGEMQRNGL